MTEIHVGQAGLRRDLATYARRFDLLELGAEPGTLPRRSRLRGWKAEVPAGFVFSLRLPRSLSRWPDAGAPAELREALGNAEALGAAWLLLSTPPEVTPCQRTRRRLAALVAELPRERWQIAWEPRGLWEDRQEEELAAELGVVLVRDLRRRPAPPGKVVYTRLLALGASARQSEAALERVAERIAGYAGAFIVVEGSGALGVRDYLRPPEP